MATRTTFSWTPSARAISFLVMPRMKWAFMDAFCPGNILFGHAENEMGINTFCLLIRQPGNGGMEFLHSHFALIQLMRRKSDEKSLMLNAIIPVKRVIRFVAVCTQTVSRLFAVELGKQIGHFVSYFNKTILCIMVSDTGVRPRANMARSYPEKTQKRPSGTRPRGRMK